MHNPRPDSALVEAFAASPNHGERRGGRKPDCVILHYTGMPTGEGALERLRDPASEVSSHYFVWENGRILQLVPETRRAWHAGASCWKRETDLNSASIGIEIVNQGHINGVPTPFPDAQIEAVAALCRDIGNRHLIDPKRFLAHSDIAPGRKIDPGEAFPWDRLAELGVGHWPKTPDVTNAPALFEGQTGYEIKALQVALATYGYHIQADGVFGPRTKAVVEAFQRRFRRARVDGVADAETRAILASLLA
jgi:N-acetylmuramoyl-L-alanine amidase